MWSLIKKNKKNKKESSSKSRLSKEDYQDLLSRVHTMQDDINSVVRKKTSKIYYSENGQKDKNKEYDKKQDLPITESNSPFLNDVENDETTFDNLDKKIKQVEENRKGQKKTENQSQDQSQLDIKNNTKEQIEEKTENTYLDKSNKYFENEEITDDKNFTQLSEKDEYNQKKSERDKQQENNNLSFENPYADMWKKDDNLQKSAINQGVTQETKNEISESKKNNYFSSQDKNKIKKSFSDIAPAPEPKNQKSYSLKTGIVVAMLGIILVTLGWGGYYYWKKNYSLPDYIKDYDTKADKKQIENKKELEYSLTGPNYFLLDTETTNKESIRQELIKISQKINQTDYNNKLVKFIVTDKNNNPLAFSRFAYLFKLNLNNNLTNLLDEKFYFCFFNDNGKVHSGLIIKIKKDQKNNLNSMLFKDQNNLVKQLSPLFLNKKIDFNKKYVFKESSYKDLKIHYVNIDNQDGSSIDYTFTDKYFLLGTSKNTLRSIIDNLE